MGALWKCSLQLSTFARTFDIAELIVYISEGFFTSRVEFFGVSRPVIIDGFLCLFVHKGLDGR